MAELYGLHSPSREYPILFPSMNTDVHPVWNDIQQCPILGQAYFILCILPCVIKRYDMNFRISRVPSPYQGCHGPKASGPHHVHLQHHSKRAKRVRCDTSVYVVVAKIELPRGFLDQCTHTQACRFPILLYVCATVSPTLSFAKASGQIFPIHTA